MGEWWIRFVATSLICFSVIGGASAETRQVVLLDSFGREFSPYAEFIMKLRAELARQSREPIDFYEVSLASARHSESARDDPFVAYIKALFADRRLDLVITVGAPAVRLVQRHRQDIFTSTPMLLTGVEQRRLEDFGIGSNDAVVSFKSNFTAIVSDILRILPETRRIAILVGSSANDQYWFEVMRRELGVFESRTEFIWLVNLSFDQIKREVVRLPEKSAVLFSTITVDAQGASVEGIDALEELHTISNAPIFGLFDFQVGKGAVGGPVISLTDLARNAASAAVRILGGETPSGVTSVPLEQSHAVYDWRELNRLGIREQALTPNSIIRFREPSIWDQYRWYFVTALMFFALESALVIAFLILSRRRQIAEREARALSGRLISGQEEERARLARELHDDVTQRLASLAIETSREERRTKDDSGRSVLRAIREGLVRLSEDVHGLAYQLHPSVLYDLGLAEAINSECERQSRLSGIPIRMDARNIPEKLPKAVALALFRVGQEAVRNVVRHARATRADVALHATAGGLQLTIRDNGVGFQATRPRTQASLGLDSMRQRISLVGGRIKIKSYPGKGTVVSAWAPIGEGEQIRAPEVEDQRR